MFRYFYFLYLKRTFETTPEGPEIYIVGEKMRFYLDNKSGTADYYHDFVQPVEDMVEVLFETAMDVERSITDGYTYAEFASSTITGEFRQSLIKHWPFVKEQVMDSIIVLRKYIQIIHSI
jgi:hypothetical protein